VTTLLYVRTAAGGTGPDVPLADLGVIISTSATWTLLSLSSPNQAEGSGGQFSARELRDSQDLFDAIVTNTLLEWSRDGSTVALSSDYVADYQIVEDLSDDSLHVNNFTASGNLTVSGQFLLSGFNVGTHFDGGPSKHNASEINVQGTYSNIPGTPENLELALSGINTALNTASAFAFGTIVADTGTAIADVGSDTITITGAGSITTTATDNPETLSIDGTALLPRDGSRPMTGNLNLGGFSISGVNNFTASGIVTLTDADLLLPVETVTPVTNLVAGRVIVVGNKQYMYDAVRGKWLSVERRMIEATKAAKAKDVYLQLGNVASLQTGHRIPRDGTIVAMAAQTETSSSWTLEVRRNNVITAIATLAVTGTGAHSVATNIDVVAGDRIQIFANTAGVSIDAPVSSIEIAWRI
jgi:hypothetical protein